MFICATVIYFGENPVGYSLFKTSNGYALQPPLAATTEQASAPIYITPAEEGWHIRGVESNDVCEQILRLIQLDEVMCLNGKLTAAS